MPVLRSTWRIRVLVSFFCNRVFFLFPLLLVLRYTGDVGTVD